MTDSGGIPEDDIALAGEYALHLMDPAARRTFEKRMRGDAALRALVRDWDEGLAAMADELPPAAPPRMLKGRIEARLFGLGATPGTSRRGRFWPRLFGAGLAGAVLAGLALVAVTIWSGPPGEAPGPALRAEIASEDGALLVAASYDAAAGALIIERRQGAPLPGRAHELWLIAEDAAAPVSLGVLPEDGNARIALGSELAQGLSGGVLAISDEPPGGSPTGQPTGDVLAVGPVEAI